MSNDHPASAAPSASDRLRRAMVLLERMEAQLEAERGRQRAPIAIVGLSCRLPGGVQDLDGLAALMESEVDTVREVPAERWTLPAEPLAGERWAAFLDPGQALRFDAGLFGISGREAARMDPQHRIVLELAWSAFEDAGLSPESLVGSRTGVYLGCSTYDNLLRLVGNGGLDDAYDSLGNMQSVLAGRVSFALGLQGPALVLDTACSSTLVAMHLACQSLRLGECERALVGGISLLLSSTATRAMALTTALSPDGRCATFDARANGYVRGEGGGMLVLRPLQAALDAGDRVLGVIKGGAVNQDGRSTGMTAPNVLAQQALHREALAQARVEASSIELVEAHGTGTSLGDPIEVEALRTVYGEGSGPPLPVGSIKAQIGHLEAAAGIAGVLKVLASMRRGRIYKQLHFRTLNPRIRLGERLRIADRAQAWPRGQGPRRAVVSSFGMSGTNATLILEEPPTLAAPADERPERPVHLLPLSASHPEPLRRWASTLADWVQARPALRPGDLARSLALGRSALKTRAALVVEDREALLDALRALAEDRPHAAVQRGEPEVEDAGLAFLFTGQGAQRAGAGAELYRNHAAFREVIDRCAAVVGPELPQVMFGPADGRLDQTGWTQPALFALEVALAALWRSWGVLPRAVMGHSVGEVAAACVAGVFSVEDGARLIAARGRLMQALPAGGGMLVLRASPEQVQPLLAALVGRVEIAATNGPKQLVLAGEQGALDTISGQLQAQGVASRRLAVSHAFHSPLMEPMLAEFGEAIAGLSFSAPILPLISNLTGGEVGEETATPAFWVRHARQAVRFTEGVAALHTLGFRRLLELGPQEVLLSQARACPGGAELILTASLRRDLPDDRALALAAGALWTAGTRLDHAAWHAPYRSAAVYPPPTPFRDQQFPLPPERPTAVEADRVEEEPLVGRRLLRPDGVLHFSFPIDTRRFPALADHLVHGQIVVPGAMWVATLLAIGEQELGSEGLELRDLLFRLPLVLEGPCELHIELRSRGEQEYQATISSVALDSSREPVLHASALLQRAPAPRTQDPAPVELPSGLPVSPEHLYSVFDARKLSWGPRWRVLTDVVRGEDEGGLRLQLPERVGGPVDPQLIDMAFTSCWAAMPEELDSEAPPWLPVAVDRIHWRRAIDTEAVVHSKARSSSAEEQRADIVVGDGRGRLCLEIEGFRLRHLSAGALRRGRRLDGQRLLHRLAWVEAPAETTRSASPAEGGVIYPELRGGPAAALAALLRLCQSLPDDGPLAFVLIAGEDEDEQLSAAACLGLLRSFANEQPSRRIQRIEVRGEADTDTILAALVRPEPELRLVGTRLELPRLEPMRGPQPERRVQVEGPVLITGGLGGLGLQLAGWLVEQGARDLVLLGRSAPGEAARQELEALAAQGVSLRLEHVDLRDAEALGAMLERLGPLSGIWHCAGVLDDAPFAELSPERLQAVLAPKLDAALALHRATQAHPPADFVLFSSLSGLLGTPGQAAYAAANAGLDALAGLRRSQGLPAISLAWTAWEGPGMAAALGAGLRRRLEAVGLGTLRSEQAFAALEAALGAEPSVLAVTPFQVPADPSARVHPLFAHRVPSRLTPSAEGTLADRVLAEIARVLGCALDELPLKRPLQEQGMDSLMAVELRDALSRVVGQELPATLVFDHPTPAALLARLAATQAAPAAEPRPVSASARGTDTAAGAKDTAAGAKDTAAGAKDTAAGAKDTAAGAKDIAIVGAACRLPGGVNDLDGLYTLLVEQRDVMEPIRADRWPGEAWHDPEGVFGSVAQRAAFVDGIHDFDAPAFSVSPAEAAVLDPQQRLALECSFEALEHAGIPVDRLDGANVGVYLGASGSEFKDIYSPRGGEHWGGLGSMMSVISGRVAYTFGLAGPALTVDTACSSSLLATLMAVEDLRNGKIDLALAGGVQVVLSPLSAQFLSRAGALSPSSRCASFGAEADGYARGEGAGVVVLKRLSEALADGDRVLAVIRGGATNQDGRSNGLTAPNGQAQARVVRRALDDARVEPQAVGMVECHGTGTPLGDPIEAAALGESLGRGRHEGAPLRIGSIKSNLGHLEAAAGVAALLKATLAVQRGTYLPSRAVEALNPRIDWKGTNLRLQQAVEPWPEGQRLCGISAFGMSGTNVHLLVSGPPTQRPKPAQLPGLLPLLLSAHDPQALRARAAAMLPLLQPGASLLDLLATLANRRASLAHRLVVLGSSVEELQQGLQAFLDERPHPGLSLGRAGRASPVPEGLGIAELAAAWIGGAEVDWRGVLPNDRLAELPPYPWQRRRAWPEAIDPGTLLPGRVLPPVAGEAEHPVLGRRVLDPEHPEAFSWTSALSPSRPAFLGEHRIGPTAVVPGVTWLDLGACVARELWGPGPVTLEDVRFLEVLALPGENPRTLRTRLTPQGPETARLEIRSGERSPGVQHATMLLRRGIPADLPAAAPAPAPSGPRLQGEELYRRGEGGLLDYGPSFRGVRGGWSVEGGVLAELALPAQAGGIGAHRMHPALLDAALQAGDLSHQGQVGFTVPVGVDRLVLHRDLASWAQVHMRGFATEGEASQAPRIDIDLRDREGRLVVQLEGLRTALLAGAPAEDGGLLWQQLWRPLPLAEAAPREPGEWLLIESAPGRGASLAAAMAERGLCARVLAAGGEASGHQALGGCEPQGAIFLASPGEPIEQSAQVLDLIRLLQGLSGRELPRLVLLTRGASGPLPDPEQAALHGLGRVIQAEHPELRCLRVDLPLEGGEEALIDELLADSAEEEVSLVDGSRRVGRLAPLAPAADQLLPAAGRSFQLVQSSPGVLGGLHLAPASPVEPPPGFVRLKLRAAGLNFRDVMMAMGLLDGLGVSLGTEAAGTVQALGEGVEGLRVGDEVFGGVGGIGTEGIALASSLFHRPPSLPAELAAGIYTVYATAAWSLDIAARVRPGERVLVHAGTGGVGQAAIAWARHRGARVFATASTEAKRRLLLELGAEAVSDSRSDAFLADAMAWSEGKGVDIVLNSLSGPLLEAGLEALAPYGRFIELGKRDVLENKRLGMLPFLKGISLILVDLDQLSRSRPVELRALMTEVLAALDSGSIAPIPTRTLPISQAASAFNELASGSHTGKRVLMIDDPAAQVLCPRTPVSLAPADGSVLITGGLGGLGLSLARSLARQGIGGLALLGRRPPDEAQRAAIAELEALGPTVRVIAADASRREDLERALAVVRAELPPLKVVLHAAGLLDDATLASLDGPRLARVFAPKLRAALLLAELTAPEPGQPDAGQPEPLDALVFFSSVAALLGSPGQGNYAAANAAMDGLATRLRSQGRPATSIQWGPVAEVGMAARVKGAGGGLPLLDPERCWELLPELLTGPPVVAVVDLDLRRFLETNPQFAEGPRLAELVAGISGRRSGRGQLAQELRERPPAEARAALREWVRQQAGLALQVPPESLGEDQPFRDLGVDSLIGLELRNRLDEGLDLDLPTTLVWTWPTLGELLAHLEQELGLSGSAPVAAPVPTPAQVKEPEPDLSALSDEALMAELAGLLD